MNPAYLRVGLMIVVYGDQILIPGSAGYVGTLTLNMLPILAATLWLHFAKGNSGANAYGPPPEATGFSPPPPGQRRVAGAATRSGASPAITA